MAGGQEIPETQYATLGDDRIAYQVFGAGNVDLVYLSGLGDCIDLRWYWPSYASFLHHLGAHARVITFDRRGMGASDPPSGEVLPGWERWADDVLTVLDLVGSEHAAFLGLADGGATSILFAATHPARTRGLILANTQATYGTATDEVFRFVQETWGTETMAEFGAPDAARDPAFRRWFAMCMRNSLSPRNASDLLHLERSIDLRQALPSVRVPTLVLHRQGYNVSVPGEGQYLAEHIPGARFALVPGGDGTIFTDPVEEILRHIEEFLTGLQPTPEPDRALAAILFTDIVESTARVSALGDHAWRHLLETHDSVARTVVEQHRGHLIKTTGDGMLATFDGPGRAIRCAMALGDALGPLGLEIRAGLHTGEVEVMGTDIAGIGVHIAARVLEAAPPGEVVVSAAVPMLVAGSGFEFDDMGEHGLKGIDGSWRLYRVVS